MGALGGGALRLFQTFLYALAFCCSAIIIGFYSYFLAILSDRHEFISKNWKAVEGISGIAVVYTIFAILLTCFLGGVSFFAFIAIVLDVLLCGAFIAIAILTRSGAHSCSGNVNTPIGSGDASSKGGFGSGGFGTGSNENTTYSVSLGTACRYNKAVFAVSIIGAFLFLFLALVQVALVRHHKKEKRFGPSPANNYTSGSGKRRFWNRKRGGAAAGAGTAAAGTAAYEHHHHNNTTATRDPEMGAVDTRPSHDTAYTGSTMAPTGQAGTGLVKDAEPVGNTTHHHHGHSTHGGYYTQPEGTGVNPYGYSINTGANANTAGRNF